MTPCDLPQGGNSGLRIFGIVFVFLGFANCHRIPEDFGICAGCQGFQGFLRDFRDFLCFGDFAQNLIIRDNRLRHNKKESVIVNCLDTSLFTMGIKPSRTAEDISLSYFIGIAQSL